MGTFAFVYACFFIINQFVTIASWSKLIIIAVMVGMIGYLLVFFLLLNKEEKEKLGDLIKAKWGKK